ncbi:MAG: 40S ribosomal protein S19, partial [Methanoregulaceae archaeon]|nr:40S ribosomal protein S19 [Methanoregulaceae archaeon]
ILRKSLQQLEAAGFITHDKTGRRVSPRGMSFMDGVARGVVEGSGQPQAA